VNGIECVRGRVTLPLTGVWVADVVCETENDQASFPAPGSSISLQIGGQGFQGVVRRASSPFGTVFARLVGGAGGFPTDIGAVAYQNTTVQTILSDILSSCGESLSPSSDQERLSQSIPSWVRVASPGWMAMANLVDALDVSGTWRVQPSGQVWLGTDTFPQTSIETFELLNYEPQELRAVIYSDNPTVLPGQSFLGGEITSVEHHVEPGKITASILFLDQQLAKVEANGV